MICGAIVVGLHRYKLAYCPSIAIIGITRRRPFPKNSAEFKLLTLAVVGTAGRTYEPQLTRQLYGEMYLGLTAALTSPAFRTVTTLVSGGAPWADHLAVHAMLRGLVSNLTLHLPARFDQAAMKYAEDGDGPTANKHHEMFSSITGIASLSEIGQALALGATGRSYQGFLARNREVARADALLAFTFGGHNAVARPGDPQYSDWRAAGLKGGGTAQTWSQSKARMKVHVCLPFEDGAATARDVLSCC